MKSYLLADSVEDYEKAYQSELLQLISYTMWITLSVCAFGFVIAVAKIVVGYMEGNPQRDVFGFFWVMAGCLLAVSAGSIATALIF